jgi:hypothetical protein
MPLKRFLLEGFITYSIDGPLSAKIDNESFEVPFEKATTVYLEVDEEEAKQVIGPTITGIELKTSRVVSPSGEITDVFINLSIIITNSNPTIICWDILDCSYALRTVLVGSLLVLQEQVFSRCFDNPLITRFFVVSPAAPLFQTLRLRRREIVGDHTAYIYPVPWYSKFFDLN